MGHSPQDTHMACILTHFGKCHPPRWFTKTAVSCPLGRELHESRILDYAAYLCIPRRRTVPSTWQAPNKCFMVGGLAPSVKQEHNGLHPAGKTKRHRDFTQTPGGSHSRCRARPYLWEVTPQQIPSSPPPNSSTQCSLSTPFSNLHMISSPPSGPERPRLWSVGVGHGNVPISTHTTFSRSQLAT